MAATDVLLVSLGSTGGLRAADAELRGALERAGARVELHACDVTDAEAFGALIDDVYARHGRIDGVVHGAGVIEDKLVHDKDPASFQRVIETKVHGARVLARTLRPDGLRFLVFFGSVSARFGNRGQADYAAAGEMLNKLAQRLDRAWDARVVSINWGPWRTTGMVSDGVMRQFAERGVHLIEVPVGLRRLAEELRHGRKGEAEVVIGGASGIGPAPAGTGTGDALLEGAIRTPGEQGALSVDRRFDLTRDPELTDHRIDGRPVLPFAYATELMAEVAHAAAGRPVAALDGIRVLAGMPLRMNCARVAFAGGHGLCLAQAGPVAFKATVLGPRMTETKEIRLNGLPSRTRISPDGHTGTVTAFVRGHSYITSGAFSTRTSLIDLDTGTVTADLERFKVTRNGRDFNPADRNFWGVTFGADNDTFWATMASAGKNYLIQGSIHDRTAHTIRDEVECPSISPDGTRIAFASNRGRQWNIYVMNADGSDLRRLTDSQATRETFG